MILFRFFAFVTVVNIEIIKINQILDCISIYTPYICATINKSIMYTDNPELDAQAHISLRDGQLSEDEKIDAENALFDLLYEEKHRASTLEVENIK